MIIKDKVGVEIEQRPEVIQMGNGLNATSDGMGTATIALDVDGLTLTNTTTDNTISVDQNGNVGTDVATDGAIHIENTGNTGIGFGVYTNIGATAEAPLVSIHADNAAFDTDVLSLRNDGVGRALFIDQDGNKTAIEIDSESTDQDVVKIVAANTTADILEIVGSSTTSGSLLKLYNSTTSFTGNMIVVNIDGATASGNGINIYNDGTGANLVLDNNNGGGYALDIDVDGNQATRVWGAKIDINNAGVGGVGGIDFSAMSDTEPLFKLTSADTDLSSKSPESDAEAGWFPVLVGTTTYAVPIYALS
ncbi:MAG: hypothetical protein IPO40_24380 [Fibrobacteres bacterium]|nr:hypothetical protein [Fibrobacterota bacterium]